MDKLFAFLMTALIIYGHILLLIDGHKELAPKFVQYQQYGFAEFYIDGKFIRYFDLRQ
jgi:hypothetical protein